MCIVDVSLVRFGNYSVCGDNSSLVRILCLSLGVFGVFCGVRCVVICSVLFFGVV